MTDEVATSLEPTYADLAGGDLGSRSRRLLLATRPKFLTASLLPVLVGTAWGSVVAGQLAWIPAILALLATALVHAASNVLNDVGDDITGTDRVNEDRIYPYTGGSRFIQNGIMTVQEMNRWGLTLLAAAVVVGAVLALLKGSTVLVFGLAGVAIAVLYSLPAVQLAGRGVGEVCILIAFGLLPVCGAAWLQSGVFDWASVLVALPAGLWVTLILLVNEVPDCKADAASGKRTLVVRLGLSGTRYLYLALHLLAFFCVAALAGLGLMPWWVVVGGLAILAGGWRAGQGIRDAATSRPALIRSIETTLALQAGGSILLIVAAVAPG